MKITIDALPEEVSDLLLNMLCKEQNFTSSLTLGILERTGTYDSHKYDEARALWRGTKENSLTDQDDHSTGENQ